MTDDLAESKRGSEGAYLDLQDKHTELEERPPVHRERCWKRITHRVVVSFGADGHVTTIKPRGPPRMFGLDAAASVGRPMAAVFAGDERAEVVTLIQRTARIRSGAAERELRLTRDGASSTLLAMATPLRAPDGEYAGAVAIFDDLTELLKAQRLAAWREVAQRIAHEIKNPSRRSTVRAAPCRRRLGGTAQERELVHRARERSSRGRRAQAAGRRCLALRAHARAHPRPPTRRGGPLVVRCGPRSIATRIRPSRSDPPRGGPPPARVDPDHLNAPSRTSWTTPSPP